MTIKASKVQTIDCQQGAVRAVRFNIDGDYCLTCGSNKSIKLWNPRKPLLLKSYLGHRYEVKDARGSTDSSRIVSGGADRYINLWDVSTGQPIRTIQAHLADINCVCFNENSTVVFSGSVDGLAKAWDCSSRSKDPIQIFSEAKDTVSSVSVLGHEIIVASLDGKLRRYDLRKGQMFCDDVLGPINHFHITRDKQCLLTAIVNGPLKLLDKDSGEVLSEYHGHANRKYRVECGMVLNDSVVVSGSEDANVYCWDLMKGTVIEKLNLHNHRIISSVSCHPSKNEILTAAEGSVYLWEFSDIKDD